MTEDLRFPEKKIDEAWKQSIEEERKRMEAATLARESKETSEGKAGPATSKQFLGLLQMLAMQAYMTLGEIENPGSGAVEVNLPQAKAFIDLLSALKDKTKGNLSKEEEDSVNALVYELQMKYTERKAELR